MDTSSVISQVNTCTFYSLRIRLLLVTLENNNRKRYQINGFKHTHTDGVPHAQIPLPGELQLVNGTFHPISTPVISGRRAYILTQFIPEGQKVCIQFRSSNPETFKLKSVFL